VLAPPDDLPDAELAAALERCWGLSVASIGYRAVGWGSHHWVAEGCGDDHSARWRHWVTVDDLETSQLADGGPPDAAFGRLRAALEAASALRQCGRGFVAAPLPATDGEPIARMTARYAVAVYPFLDGKSFSGGEYTSDEHRMSVLGLITAVHSAPEAARRHALAEDFAIPSRDQLEAACQEADRASDVGPYAKDAACLIGRHAELLRQLLARYDGLVARARTEDGWGVLTHGEPHAANTMLTADGWMLLDWDTALIAPPERDLWHLDPGDGTILGAYADAAGVVPRQALLDLYRLGWDLTDLALAVGRFRRPHAGDANDDKTWRVLTFLLDRHSSVA